jgi:capsule biosynthesis phosphatase
MRYCFDLDGVICSVAPHYVNAEPNYEVIHRISELRQEGHVIIINTARGMSTYKGNVAMVYQMYFDFTIDQLTDWGVEYDEIYFGKPAADHYIDDKAINIKDF